MKKILSQLIAVVMSVSVLGAIPVSAEYADSAVVSKEENGIVCSFFTYFLDLFNISFAADSEKEAVQEEIIDQKYINELVSEGVIEVSLNREGRLGTIIGKFTDKTVDSPETAASVLNSASSLFGRNFHADVQDISAEQDGDEVFYRYSPTVNGIPVSGSQIIISAKNGEVTGLHSTYNSVIEDMELGDPITADEAIKIACYDLFCVQNLSEIVDMLAEKSELPRERVIGILYESLSVDAHLEISDARRDPKLTWVVTLEKNNVNDYDENFEYDDDEYLEIVLTDNDFVYEDEIVYTGINIVYYYVKYFSIYYEYTIYACGENAGEFLYIDDGVEE